MRKPIRVVNRKELKRKSVLKKFPGPGSGENFLAEMERLIFGKLCVPH